MNQKQKDTIREEFESQWKTLIEELHGLDKNSPPHFLYVLLEQAYQSGFKAGAKDKVEEVIEMIQDRKEELIAELKNTFDEHTETRIYEDRKIVSLLKDNT